MIATTAIEKEPAGSSIKDKGSGQVAASVIGLSKRFGKTVVLEDINFHVAEGEILVLLGASGSGKTTILRIIAGLEEPDSGRVILHQKDVSDLPARERGVGVIFQSYALFPKMTVEKNVGYGLRIRKRRRKEIKATVDELLTLVQLQDHRKKYPSQLSGGQQQRVAIARTLAYKPDVLLFDEPFGALDTQTRVHLRREIRRLLKKVNVPSIFITHDQEEALELGDRVAVLKSGHIEQIGTPDEVYDHPASEYVATFLGAANILTGTLRGNRVVIGAASIPVHVDENRFSEGQKINLVFRPEDVFLGPTKELPVGYYCLANAIVDEVNFAGASERVSLKLDLVGPETCNGANESFYLTTETPESPATRPIIANRAKPVAQMFKLKAGDRVVVGLSSFTVFLT